MSALLASIASLHDLPAFPALIGGLLTICQFIKQPESVRIAQEEQETSDMKYSLPPNGDRNPMGWTHAHSSSSEAATGYSQLAISNGQISEHKQEERYSLARIIQDAYSEEDEGSKAER